MIRIIALALSLAVLVSDGFAQEQGTKADYERAARVGELSQGKVFRIRVSPNWLEGNRFWYRVATGADAFEWVLAEADGKLTRFYSEAALTTALGGKLDPETVQHLTADPQPSETDEMDETDEQVDLVFDNQANDNVFLFWVSDGERVPYGKVAPGEKYTQSTYGGQAWEVRDAGGTTLGYVTAPALGGTVRVDGNPAAPSRGEEQQTNPGASPDGKWVAFLKADNLWLRPTSGGEEVALSHDGKPKDSYDGTNFFWSPDSTKLVAFRTEAAEEHLVYTVASSPQDQVQPKLVTLDYLKPNGIAITTMCETA